MPKHRAERQLTDQNWDQEEEPEEAGEFKQASEDVLKQRKIKKAFRRTCASADSASGSAFSGFSGFGALGGNSGSLFTKPTTNGSSVTTTTGQVAQNIKLFEVPKSSTQSAEPSTTSGVNGVKKKGDNSSYLKQLKALNEGVSSWIKQHVEKNPYCLLTPIFSDYEKHLSEIEGKYPKRKNVEKDTNKTKIENVDIPKPEVTKSPEKPTTSGFSFASNAAPILKSESPAKSSAFSGFTFGADSTSGFKPAFSFGSGTPNTTSENNQTAQGNEEEEYVPPKSDVKVVEEDGAVYTKRCKLFYQKDGAWADKGVGNLHLKEIEGNSQLVVRADTNLGNVLLNIRVSASLPVKRQGKNNVSLMCIPNPPLDPKKEEDKTAVPMLIRVKTGEEADELLAKINELKK